MKIVKNNKRISVLGLIKFLSAIAIVYFHVGISEGDYWEHLWLLVELFFFITGYFTFRHFRKKGNRGVSLEQRSKNAIAYTVKKFTPFIPYIVVAIIIKYIALLPRSNDASFFSVMKILPLDILLLNSQVSELNWPLWFLSAMLIVFPLFCIMCQIKHKYTLYILLLTSSIVYYFNIFDGGVSHVQCLIRAFFAMSTGILVYAFSTYIKKNKRIKRGSIYLLLIWLCLVAVSILCLYPTRYNSGHKIYGNIFIVLSALWLSILLSGKTILSQISSPLMDYFERLSMIIYLIHVPIIYILQLTFLSSMLSDVQLVFATISLSIIISILLNTTIPMIVAKLKVEA